MWTVVINHERCTGCGECLDACPGEVCEEMGGRIEAVRPGECHGCHTREAVCPEGACSVQDE